ncbi:hypothetical protein [Shewanella baltica]|uniref:hypothetical protein n=1 Tax=Shewanella baltica TaxID=62322 RepID=UPI00325D9B1A
MKFLVIIFGIAVSIVMHGSGLSVDNKWWWDLLLSFNVKALSENLGIAVFCFWIHLPLMIIFSLACALIINRVGYPRYFIYSVLGTSFFTFIVVPLMPVFDVLLAGGMSSLRFIDIFVKTLMFLTLFFFLRSLFVKLESESIEP